MTAGKSSLTDLRTAAKIINDFIEANDYTEEPTDTGWSPEEERRQQIYAESKSGLNLSSRQIKITTSAPAYKLPSPRNVPFMVDPGFQIETDNLDAWKTVIERDLSLIRQSMFEWDSRNSNGLDLIWTADTQLRILAMWQRAQNDMTQLGQTHQISCQLDYLRDAYRCVFQARMFMSEAWTGIEVDRAFAALMMRDN